MTSQATQALALALAGVDANTIADRLNYADATAAMADVIAAGEEQYGITMDPLRGLEVLRLNRLQAAVWPAAMKGDPAAVSTALSIGDRRVRMLRLNQRSNG